MRKVIVHRNAAKYRPQRLPRETTQRIKTALKQLEQNPKDPRVLSAWPGSGPATIECGQASSGSFIGLTS
jgi:hypothetical protein